MAKDIYEGISIAINKSINDGKWIYCNYYSVAISVKILYNYNMSKFDKLLERFIRKPNDFSYDELRSLLKGLGYAEDSKGKTSGSRVAFININTKHIIRLHRPNPSNLLKSYQINLIFDELKTQGVIK